MSLWDRHKKIMDEADKLMSEAFCTKTVTVSAVSAELEFLINTARRISGVLDSHKWDEKWKPFADELGTALDFYDKSVRDARRKEQP